jgi:hypothetical protein
MRPLSPREIARYICVVVFAIAAMAWLRLGSMFDPVWTSGGGEPVPRNFSYMLFPRTGAGIVDGSGERIGSFQRALMLDDEHYRADGPVDVGGARGVRHVAKSDLTPTPPPGTLDMLWNDWQEHASDCQSSEFSTRTRDDGTVLATLRCCRVAHCYRFVYEIDGETMRPLQMYRTGGDVALGPWTLLGLLGVLVVFRVVGVALDRMLPATAATTDKPAKGLAATSAL